VAAVEDELTATNPAGERRAGAFGALAAGFETLRGAAAALAWGLVRRLTTVVAVAAALWAEGGDECEGASATATPVTTPITITAAAVNNQGRCSARVAAGIDRAFGRGLCRFLAAASSRTVWAAVTRSDDGVEGGGGAHGGADGGAGAAVGTGGAGAGEGAEGGGTWATGSSGGASARIDTAGGPTRKAGTAERPVLDGALDASNVVVR